MASPEREQTPASRAAPRTAGALLQRTPALSRAHEPVQTLGDPRVADNAGVVFMDLNALARHLASEPKHPVYKTPLDITNIRDYAFRID